MRAARRRRSTRDILGALDDILRDHRPRRASSTPASTRISSTTSKPSSYAGSSVEVAGKLHTGRSRNDIDHTVFKLALQGSAGGVVRRTPCDDRGVAGRGRARARNHRRRLYARPAGAAHDLRPLSRRVHRAVAARHWTGCCTRRTPSICRSMGAAAITTSGFGLDRKRMADLLGFAGVQENSYGCIAAADYATGVYAALKLVFIHAGRFVQDLNTWTGFEIGHLHVPDAFVQVSSIMPQKRNPVPVEHLRLMASLGAARCEAVLTAVHNTPFTDMNDSEGEVQIAGYDAFDTAHRFMALLGGLLEAASDRRRESSPPYRRGRHHARRARRLAGAHRGDLVPPGARGREQACAPHDRRRHDVVEDLVRRVPADIRGGDRPVRRASPKPISGASPRPEHFIAVRTMQGGPAPAPLAASFARYRGEIAAKRAAIDALAARAERAAEDMLAREVRPPHRRRLRLVSRTHGAIGTEGAAQAVRRRRGGARHRPRRRRTRNSSCWSGRRAAASRRSCG